MDRSAREPVLVDLALQGGGSHGAFTWGVLDRLLEEPWLKIEAISGTSAGAMNARRAGGRLDARRRRRRAGRARRLLAARVARLRAFSPLQRSPLDRLMGRWTLDTSPAYLAMDLMSRVVSPYDLNPLGLNPLRDILDESIDFEQLGAAPDQAVHHRDQRAHRPRPHLPQQGDHRRRAARLGLPADHVPGDRDRRRALLGRRLRRQSDDDAAGARKRRARHDPGADQSARTRRRRRARPTEILNRLNEISFNSPLMKELRMIALLRQVADPGHGEGARWARNAHAPDHDRQARRLRRVVEAQRRVGVLSTAEGGGPASAADAFLDEHGDDLGKRSTADLDVLLAEMLSHERLRSSGLLGILVGLGLLIWFAFRGWSVLLLAPIAALDRGAVLARAAAGALDADLHAQRGGLLRPVLSAVPARRAVRQADGGQRLGHRDRRLHDREARRRSGRSSRSCSAARSSPMAASACSSPSSCIAPMAQDLFRAAGIPRRLMPAAIVLGTSTFTMSALPGTPSIQNTIPMPFFGTTPFAAPGPRHHRLADHARLRPVVAAAPGGRREGATAKASATARRCRAEALADDETLRERATTAREFDPAEIAHGEVGRRPPSGRRSPRCRSSSSSSSISCMSLIVLPRLDLSFLAEARLGRDVARRGHRRLVGDHGARLRDRDRARAQLSGACRSCARPWTPAPTPPRCRRSASRASSASAPWWRRCRPSPWCATRCSASAAGRWCRWRSRPTSSPR